MLTTRLADGEIVSTVHRLTMINVCNPLLSEAVEKFQKSEER
jgi:hypothetical protein